jgi:predicted alpha/beta hydrolase
VKNSFGKEITHHFYDQLELPILILNATDDPIATKPNVTDLIELFPNAAAQAKWLHPQEHGLQIVGHMGFFWPQSSALWRHVLSGFQLSDH